MLCDLINRNYHIELRWALNILSMLLTRGRQATGNPVSGDRYDSVSRYALQRFTGRPRVCVCGWNSIQAAEATVSRTKRQQPRTKNMWVFCVCWTWTVEPNRRNKTHEENKKNKNTNSEWIFYFILHWETKKKIKNKPKNHAVNKCRAFI